MAQIYFLSILLNTIGGLVLVYEPSSGKSKKKNQTNYLENFTFLESSSFRLVLGILLLFAGVMKLLSVYGGGIPVIGDLVPALCSLTAGFSILLEYYEQTSENSERVPENVNKIFIGGKKYIGYACFVVAFLHFVFPSVILL